jgi:hypothetical protein
MPPQAQQQPPQTEQAPQPVQPQQQAEQQPVQPQAAPVQEPPQQQQPAEAAAPPLSPEEQARQDAIRAIMDDEKKTIQKVAAIVNQPVTHYMRLPSIQPGMFSPGWFHDGAVKPDFDRVDVRKTQEFPYAKQDYVTSDLNPNEMFKGDELEFNAQTKFFYIDRTVPKKKLTPQEMAEINRLYRIIGQDEHKLQALRSGVTGKKSLKSTIFKAIGILLAAAVAFLFAMKKPKPPAAKA